MKTQTDKLNTGLKASTSKYYLVIICYNFELVFFTSHSLILLNTIYLHHKS